MTTQIGAIVPRATGEEKPDAKQVDRETIERLTEFYAGRYRAYGFDDRDGELFATMTSFCAYYFGHLARRGLMLVGSTGNGKTKAFNILAKLFDIKGHTAIDLVKTYRASTETYDEHVGPQPFYEHQRPQDIIIDDIGAEPTVNDYGNRFELMGNLITERYTMFRESGAKTFIATNLDEQEFVGRYGLRIWSRLREMCTWVAVSSADRRSE